MDLGVMRRGVKVTELNVPRRKEDRINPGDRDIAVASQCPGSVVDSNLLLLALTCARYGSRAYNRTKWNQVVRISLGRSNC